MYIFLCISIYRHIHIHVGIKSPEAAGAGEDCAEAMVREKLTYYARHLPELERKGITYVPLTFSCFGRRHGTTSKIMREAAVRAARSRGSLDHAVLLQRWHATVTAEIWRRAARMVKRCLPKLDNVALTLLGDVDGAMDAEADAREVARDIILVPDSAVDC